MKMRLLRLLPMTGCVVLLLVLPLCGMAQEGGMVKWEFTSVKVAEQVYEFTAKAVVADGWHIYSQGSGEGSLPTKFTFTANPFVKLDGKVLEKGELVKKRNEVMESELRYYADSVMFVQKIKILCGALDDKKGARELVLQGKVAFMTCNDQMCLPEEEIPFKIELK